MAEQSNRRVLEIAITAGSETCASEPGKLCQYLGRSRFGTVTVCMLFPASGGGAHTVLGDVRGWARRCKACSMAEKRDNEETD